jgi:hypothetical protein
VRALPVLPLAVRVAVARRLAPAAQLGGARRAAETARVRDGDRGGERDPLHMA